MLAWSPPLGAEYVEPMADAQTLVRFLGGLPRTSCKSGEDPSAGDVVYRTADGGLVMRWPLVYSRLDSFVRNMIQPIVVLDNVPWAFAAPGAWKAQQPVGYGNNMAPENVTEYKGFVRTLLQGLVRRYGLSAVRSFAFRVGTEPDTQPAHWNDTNANFVSMYAAVAEAVDDVVPGAMLGPGNFAADGPDRAESWRRVVVPILEGILARRARVSFLAMSSYGRAIMCKEPHVARRLRLDSDCEYSVQFSAETAQRLASLRALLPEGSRGLPLQVME